MKRHRVTQVIGDVSQAHTRPSCLDQSERESCGSRSPQTSLDWRLSSHSARHAKVPGGDVDPSRVGYVRVHLVAGMIVLLIVRTVLEVVVLMIVHGGMMLMVRVRVMMMMHTRMARSWLARNASADGKCHDIEHRRIDTPSARIGSHRR